MHSDFLCWRWCSQWAAAESLLGGIAGSRVDLLWSETDGELQGYWELEQQDVPWRLGPDTTGEPDGAVLDLADGTPRLLPLPWTDVKSPPLDVASPDGVEQDSFNLPTPWVVGSQVTLEALFTTSSVQHPGGLNPAIAEIRVVAPPGTTLDDGDVFAHGETVAATTDSSPVPSVDRFEIDVQWSFEARKMGESEWMPVPGHVTTTHVLYGLVDEPVVGFASTPHRAWVDVVDAVTGWVDGAGTDPDLVAGILVQRVFNDLGLVYDHQSGACTYTDYPGWGYGGCEFDMAAFQRREFGSIINCSDAAAILSTYANMVGIDFNYHILTNESPWGGGFDLNYIIPIGFTEFDETPFASGGGGFSYHAVVGPAADDTIFDATLVLDGDGTPTAPPHTVMYADGLTEYDYLFALSSEWDIISVDYNEKVVIQQFSKGAKGVSDLLSTLLAPEGMVLLSTRGRAVEGGPLRLVYGFEGEVDAAVLVDILEAASPRAAKRSLEGWNRSLAGENHDFAGIGDAAFGGGSALGFTLGDTAVFVRSVDPEVPAEQVALQVAAALRIPHS